ncbi:hypothetical protein ACFLZP_01815 [Patescibacteria group bacterium]
MSNALLSAELYPYVFKISYLVFIIPTLLVIITAFMSAREMGGTLGKGLKKIAAGSVIETSLIMSYLLLEQTDLAMSTATENLVHLSFIINGLAGTIFLISGFIQVYKITKELRLFTP